MLGSFKKYAFLPILLVLFLGTFSISFAGFNEDYQGYLKTYDEYRGTYDAYYSTRSQYLSYGTLNAQNDALNAVKNMLVARDATLISYFGLLLSQNADPTLATEVNSQTAFLTTHKTQVPAVSTLDDAVSNSKEVESRNLDMQILSRKTVATIILAKVSGVKNTYLQLENDVTALTHNLLLNGKDVSTLERWLLEAKNKELLADQKLSEASGKIAALHTLSLDQLTEQYNGIQFTLFEANQYMKEALRFLTELSESIKYGQY